MNAPALYAPMRAAAEPDRILIAGDMVYNCYLMPGVRDTSDPHILQEPIWRIERVSFGARKMPDMTVEETYSRMYPNGSTAFEFKASECKGYTYYFKR